MTGRAIWEERLFSTNEPLPRRELPADHPLRGLPRTYIDGNLVLQPWTYWALAPVPAEWDPLLEHHEAAYLARNGQLRVGLIDYSEGTVIDWRKTGLAKTWQPRPTRPKPSADEDEPAPDPISKPRRARQRRHHPERPTSSTPPTPGRAT